MKLFKLNYHSIIDVITNSSSELFICTDSKILDFFKSIIGNNSDGLLKIQKFKDFYDENDLDYYKENYPKNYNRIYGNLKNGDDLLVCYYNSEEIEYTLSELLGKMNFINIYK